MIANNFMEAIGLLQGFTAAKCADGELSDDELNQMRGELEAIIDAIDYVIDLRQTALQAAGEKGQPRQEI